MNRLYISHIVTSIIIVLVQILLLKNIQIVVFEQFTISVLIYPIIVIFLPVELRRSAVVLVAFFLGLFVDTFYDSPGVHTAALVLTGFLRGTVLRLLEPRQGYRNNVGISPSSYGFSWFMYYLGILLFVHIFTFYSLDAFTFVFIIKILVNTLLSFFVSYIVITLYKLVA